PRSSDRAARELHAGDATALDGERVDARREANLHAGRLKVLAHAADDAGQAIGADVRARVDADVGRRTVGDERIEHGLRLAALGRTRVELAVGERARPTLAE